MQSALATQNDPSLEQSLAPVADVIEASAWNDMFSAAPAWLRTALGLRAQTTDGVLMLSASALDHLLFNRVIGLDATRAGQELALARVLEAYESQGVQQFWIQANTTLQASLGRLLKARGLRPYHRSWVKMLRTAAPITPPATTITVRVAQEADAFAIASIVGPAFDLPQLAAELFVCVIDRPRWHVLIAECNGEPIAAGALYVKDDIGYFAFAATRPSFRRLGAQRLLMSARAQIALDAGCRWLVTETGMPLTADEPNPSYHNMLWAGFRPIAVRANFGPAGTSWRKL